MNSFRPNGANKVPQMNQTPIVENGLTNKNIQKCSPSTIHKDELSNHFKRFSAVPDSMQEFPLPSQVSQNDESQENICENKDVRKYVDERERTTPIHTDSVSECNLIKDKLKKTGVNLTGDIESEIKYGSSVNDSEPIKNTIGKLDKNRFKGLSPPAIPQKGKRIGAFSNPPQLKDQPNLTIPKPELITNVTSSPPVIGPKPRNMSINYKSPPPSDELLQTSGDDIYDDVDSIVETNNTEMQTKNIDNNQKEVEEEEEKEEEEDDIYDAVENVVDPGIIDKFEKHTSHNDRLGMANQSSPTPPTQTSNFLPQQKISNHSINSATDENDEIYDDVEPPPMESKPLLAPKPSITSRKPAILQPVIAPKPPITSQKPAILQPVIAPKPPLTSQKPATLQPVVVPPCDTGDIYDDVDPSIQSLPELPLEDNNNNELYLMPSDEVYECNDTPDINSVPPKPEKVFGQLEMYRFSIPRGLDAWLYQFLSSNKSKLQINGMTEQFYDSYKCIINFPGKLVIFLLFEMLD